MSQLWIAFFGVRGSGKSTLGEYLADTFQFKVDAFANPLKRAAQTIFGFSDEDTYGPSQRRETQYPAFENSGWCFACNRQCFQHTVEGSAANAYPWYCPSCKEIYPRYVNPRHALKTLGTEWGRRVCPNLWVQALFTGNAEISKLAITDGRFINENEACRERGVTRILLTRGLKESVDPHPSEAEARLMAQAPADYFDVMLDNAEQELGATKSQLYDIVRSLLTEK